MCAFVHVLATLYTIGVFSKGFKWDFEGTMQAALYIAAAIIILSLASHCLHGLHHHGALSCNIT